MAMRQVVGKHTLSRLIKNRALTIGLVLVVAASIVGLLAPLLAPADPLETRIELALQAPGRSHPFGTDELGRDILSRVISGVRVTTVIALLSVVMGGAIGTSAGLISGYLPGWPDRVIMRLVDIMMAFPGILLAMVIIAILGPALKSVIIAVGITTIPYYARVARGLARKIAGEDFVEAANAIGCSPGRILLRYLFPNMISPMLVVTTLTMAIAILTEASLSYLGLGAQPPTPELGAMLASGRTYIYSAWWATVAPGSVIVLIVLGINMLGDGLRDALDPRLRI